jgi:adenylate cyclase
MAKTEKGTVPSLRKLCIGIAIGAIAAALAIGLASSSFLRTVELTTYDWRMRMTARPDAPSDDIVLVSIDDDSVRRLAPLVGRWPWPRLIHAFLVDYLARAKPLVIVYDVLFIEPDVRRFDVGDDEWSGKASDDEFAKSVARAGNVVLAADATAEPLIDPSRAIATADEGRPRRHYDTAGACIEERGVIVKPLASLDRAAVAIGHTLLVRDGDGPLRHHRPFVRVGDVVLPSMPLAAVLVVTRDRPPAPVAGGCPPLMAYRGPALLERDRRPTFREFSFYDLYVSEEQILANQPPQVDPATFRDKIVVVSATASGTYDVHVTPFGQGIGGGEVHANVIDALLRGRSITPAAPSVDLIVTVAAAVAVGSAGAFMGVWVLAAIAAAYAVVLIWASLPLFSSGTWVLLIQPLLAIALAYGGQLAWQYFVEGREKRQVKQLFSRFVPRDVFAQLMAHPENAALGGTRRTMTVLFSDVRGFTALSERSSPEEVVAQLNEYFTRMVDVLFAHRGTLDKFVGDMVMGLFGAPLEDPQHADHAVEAALAMTVELDRLNRDWAAAGRPVLDIGIGISTGEMVAGNIGSDTIMSYTVIGDTVNLGARLESLNKDYGTRVIISDGTRAALRGDYDVRPLGEVVVKGKSRPVAIYEVKSA